MKAAAWWASLDSTTVTAGQEEERKRRNRKLEFLTGFENALVLRREFERVSANWACGMDRHTRFSGVDAVLQRLAREGGDGDDDVAESLGEFALAFWVVKRSPTDEEIGIALDVTHQYADVLRFNVTLLLALLWVPLYFTLSPSKELLLEQTTAEYRKLFPGCYVVVYDCREVRHGASTGSLLVRQMCWSEKSHCNVTKILAGVTPTTFVVHLSELLGGRAPEVYGVSFMRSALPGEPEECAALFDRGFARAEPVVGSIEVMPTFLEKHRASFGNLEARLNSACSHYRWLVERFFGTLAMRDMSLRVRAHHPFVMRQLCWLLAVAEHNSRVLHRQPLALDRERAHEWFSHVRQLLRALDEPDALIADHPEVTKGTRRGRVSNAMEKRVEQLGFHWPGASRIFTLAREYERQLLGVCLDEPGAAGAINAHHRGHNMSLDLMRALVDSYVPTDDRASRLCESGFVALLKFDVDATELRLGGQVRASMKANTMYSTAVWLIEQEGDWAIKELSCDCPQGRNLLCSHVKAMIMAYDSLMGGRRWVVATAPLDLTDITSTEPVLSVAAATSRARGAASTPVLDLPLRVHPSKLDIDKFIEDAQARASAIKQLTCPNEDCKDDKSYSKIGHLVRHVYTHHAAWLRDVHGICVSATPTAGEKAQVKALCERLLAAILAALDNAAVLQVTEGEGMGGWVQCDACKVWHHAPQDVNVSKFNLKSFTCADVSWRLPRGEKRCSERA